MFDLTVKYEDGTEVTVAAGQREMAAWEMAGHGSSVDATDTKPVAFSRFLAYTALRRTRQLPENSVKGTTMPFDVWSDRVDEVLVPDEEEAEADPTTASPPPAGSRTSRSRQGSRSPKS